MNQLASPLNSPSAMAGTTAPERTTDQIISMLGNRNNDLHNLLMEMRDNLVRLTGTNGVDVQPEAPQEAPPEGFTNQVHYHLGLLDKNISILSQIVSQTNAL